MLQVIYTLTKVNQLQEEHLKNYIVCLVSDYVMLVILLVSKFNVKNVPREQVSIATVLPSKLEMAVSQCIADI